MSTMIKTILFLEMIILISSNSINKTENCYSNFENFKNFEQNNIEKNLNGDIILDAAELLKKDFIKLAFSLFEGNLDDELYDIIENLDQDCWDFILKFFFNEKDFMNDISKKLIHDGGLIQYSMSAEEDCIDEDSVYLLFTGIYNRNDLKEGKTYRDKEALFREANIARQEVCIFKECKNTYKRLFQYLTWEKFDIIKGLFRLDNVILYDIDYKNITDEEQVPYFDTELETMNKKMKYYEIITYIIFGSVTLLIILSIISCIVKQRETKKTEIDIQKTNTVNEMQLNNYKKLKEEEEIKSNKVTDSKVFKIISSFEIIKNLSILNQIQEPLSNQNKLTALGSLKLIVLFYIMLGENTFIIFKYTENEMPFWTFLKKKFFFLIKLGMNSYESYKVLCGAAFGYKFISFYYKHEKDTKCKITALFLSKIIPYIIIFYIIHFFLNYPIFIYSYKLFYTVRNAYMIEIMEKCPCQNEGPLQIFNISSIMGNYNSTEFNIGQYNGCYRPILFTYSEISAFFMVLFFALLNILFKKYSKSNLIFSIFFFLNFVYLGFTFFITREVKDLIGEYTISRLFGLSGEIAMPYMFFPLYYIGFNIGIIYYYRKNIQKNIKNKKVNIFDEENFLINDEDNEILTVKNIVLENIPFKYCDWIANNFISKFSEIVKYIFMFIFLGLIIVLSLSFTFLINSIKEDEVLFTFEEKKIAKYIFVYEGILHGIFFSFFLLLYLCLDDDSFIKSFLSSEFFTFVNKISFVLFISFISVLNFFHSIGMMEIYLFPFSLYVNTLILFMISCILAIIISCMFLFPIKWIYLYVSEGFHTKKLKQKL